MNNDKWLTILVAVFLFGGVALSLFRKRWEYTLIGLYLIFILGILQTAGSAGWAVLLWIIISIAFYGLYILLKFLDDKVYEWRNREK